MGRSPAKAAVRPTPAAKALSYKVVELSNVDESALEETVNAWVSQGWSFDGVQFAMRESSKRPAMAFVFFTRLGAPAESYRSDAAAEAHLRRIVLGDEEGTSLNPAPQRTTADAWSRLAELAEGEDE